jgi:glycosyltransferase involved in cell wall biosynthesis
VNVLLVYRDALKGGGYPRDVRALARSLAAGGVRVALLAEMEDAEKGVDESVAGVEIFDWCERESAFGWGDIAHFWGLFVLTQVLSSRSLPRKTVAVVSPLAQLAPAHLAHHGWKKKPYIRALRTWLPRSIDGAHVLDPIEVDDAAVVGLTPAFAATFGIHVEPRVHAVSPLRGPFLFFGRNDVLQKGLDVLIDGYALAVRHGVDRPLVIAGRPDGGSTSVLRRRARERGISSRVEIVGEVNDASRRELLAGARVIVFASRWDGPPRPVREALGQGTPVVVTPRTYVGKMVSDYGAGAVVAPSAEALAEALLQAEDDGVVESWRRGAAKLAPAATWDRVASAYAKGYAALACGCA